MGCTINCNVVAEVIFSSANSSAAAGSTCEYLPPVCLLVSKLYKTSQHKSEQACALQPLHHGYLSSSVIAEDESHWDHEVESHWDHEVESHWDHAAGTYTKGNCMKWLCEEGRHWLILQITAEPVWKGRHDATQLVAFLDRVTQLKLCKQSWQAQASADLAPTQPMRVDLKLHV
jgi:hypothetical protein